MDHGTEPVRVATESSRDGNELGRVRTGWLRVRTGWLRVLPAGCRVPPAGCAPGLSAVETKPDGCGVELGGSTPETVEECRDPPVPLRENPVRRRVARVRSRRVRMRQGGQAAAGPETACLVYRLSKRPGVNCLESKMKLQRLYDRVKRLVVPDCHNDILDMMSIGA